MSALTRTDTSTLGRWWWTVDRWTLIAIAALIVFGMILSVAASPPVARRIDLDPFHFVRRHLFMPESMREAAYAKLAWSAVSRIGRLLGEGDSPSIAVAAEALASRIEPLAR